MHIQITLTLDVGSDPTADATAYSLYQFDDASHLIPMVAEECAESVILDLVQGGIDDQDHEITHWSVVDSHVEVLDDAGRGL